MTRHHVFLIGTSVFATSAQAAIQVPLDRSDPGLATRQAHDQQVPVRTPKPQPSIVLPAEAGAELGVSGAMIREVEIYGAADVTQSEIAPVVSSFIGHRLSKQDLRDLLAIISGVARAKGYLFAHSSIPPQSIIAGVLHVRLDEGRIDEVRLTGESGNRAVAWVFSHLVGHPPKRAELERQLMLAQDLPGIRLGKVEYRREGEKGVLIVPVSRDRVTARASLDNWGDHELGPVRAQASVQFNGVVGETDQLSIQGLATPFQPRELKVLSGRYALQPGSGGTEVALFGSIARTRSGGFLRRFDDHGRSYSLGASIYHPLVRSRKASLWFGGEFGFVAVDERFGDLAVRRDRVATASLSLNGYLPLAGGRLRGGAGVTQGLGILAGTRAGDPLASRPEAGRHFTLAQFWSNWTGDLGGPFSAKLAVAAQLTTQPLLAVEQISIGGPNFGRAYDFSERAGDKGILGSAELQAKLLDRSTGLLRWAQLYGFGDAGRVRNLRNRFGTGSLYSAGFGLRAQVGKPFRLGLEAAFPINKPRFGSGDKSPRISATLTTTF